MSQVHSYFRCDDAHALGVLVHFAEDCGAEVTAIRPVNEKYVVRVTSCFELEVTRDTNLTVYHWTVTGESRDQPPRTYWQEIETLPLDSIEFLEVFGRTG